MPKHQGAISFEAPLYRHPSEHLRNFMKKLEKRPVPCHAVWREDQKLTFYISKSEKATVTPFLKKSKKNKTVLNKMPAFASKFNVTNIAAVKNEAIMKFELLSLEDLKNRGENLDPIYGEGVVCVMRVTVICVNEEAENVLLNFFGILDISIEPLSFYLQLQDWPSKNVFDFMRHLEQDKIPCYVEAKGREEVVFTTEGQEEKETIRIPIRAKREDRKKVAKRLSIFASKFNATATFIARGQVSIKINFEIVQLDSHEEHPKCDEGTMCIMQVNVACNEAEARNALGDFFKMLDKYGN